MISPDTLTNRVIERAYIGRRDDNGMLVRPVQIFHACMELDSQRTHPVLRQLSGHQLHKGTESRTFLISADLVD